MATQPFDRATPDLRHSFHTTGVTVISLNRPSRRNALSQRMIDDLVAIIDFAARDELTRVVILTGSTPDGPFSAGADLHELMEMSTSKAHQVGWLKDLSDAVSRMRKPIICAVEGFALGGGFELAMLCDIVYASATSRFGLPEVKVGTIPGMGGTQRLTRAMGKQKAMALILTGDTMGAEEAEEWGLVTRVWPQGETLREALKLAETIAGQSAPVVQAAKESVLEAERSAGLDVGCKVERGLYYSTFSLEDFKEGVGAFLNKRKAVWKHR